MVERLVGEAIRVAPGRRSPRRANALRSGSAFRVVKDLAASGPERT
jgi:hypothetical protein